MLATHIQIMKPARMMNAIDGIWLLRCFQTTPSTSIQSSGSPPAAAAHLVEADRRERADQREGEGEGHDQKGWSAPRAAGRSRSRAARRPRRRTGRSAARRGIGPAGGKRGIDVVGGDPADRRPHRRSWQRWASGVPSSRPTLAQIWTLKFTAGVSRRPALGPALAPETCRASAAAMKASRSPSRTPEVSEVSTLVRRSFTIW